MATDIADKAASRSMPGQKSFSFFEGNPREIADLPAAQHELLVRAAQEEITKLAGAFLVWEVLNKFWASHDIATYFWPPKKDNAWFDSLRNAAE